MLVSGLCACTPGKAITGLMVADQSTGEKAGYGRCLLRVLVTWFAVAVVSPISWVFLLWPIWDRPYRRTVGGAVTRTVTVRRRPVAADVRREDSTG